MDTTLLDGLEKAAKVLALAVAGAWVYLNTIRGRTFIPRLQPMISASIIKNNTHQYLLVDVQVKNVGSAIARVKEKGTGLKVTSLRSPGGTSVAMDLFSEEESAFPVFGLAVGEVIKIEPGTVLYGQELIEIPEHKYEAFRLELRVSALRGSLTRKNRRWRAFAIVAEASPPKASVPLKE